MHILAHQTRGNYEIQRNKKNKLIWFQTNRKVKVLEFSKDRTSRILPIKSNRLGRAVSKSTKIYQYIHNWYNDFLGKKYKNKPLMIDFYKIKYFHIKNYKVIKDLTLKLCSDNNTPLPIIVIAQQFPL